MLGRSGVVQSAFTLKEIRELSQTPGFELYIYKPDVDAAEEDFAYLYGNIVLDGCC